MRSIALCALFAVTACDDGGTTPGRDALPKRGERATDPTVITITATCWLSVSPPPVVIEILGSDPMGDLNLGTCQVTLDGRVEDGQFGDASDDATCAASFATNGCAGGASHVVDVLVSNKTGGFTQASVALVARTM